MPFQYTCPVCSKAFLHPKSTAVYCSKPCSNRARRVSAQTRFWNLVDRRGDDECWLWLAARDRDGYGLFTLDVGKQTVAHRFAYQDQRGEIPAGARVLHTCDNPPCCNPAHLFVGTSQDNSNDMVAKKRHQHGETHWKARLTEADVRYIRDIYATGTVTMEMLAAAYSVRADHINDIIHKRRWKHVV